MKLIGETSFISNQSFYLLGKLLHLTINTSTQAIQNTKQ